MPLAHAAAPARSRRPGGDRVASPGRIAGVVALHGALLWSLALNGQASSGIAAPQSFAVELLPETATETPPPTIAPLPTPTPAPRASVAATASAATAPASVAASETPAAAMTAVASAAAAGAAAPTAVTPPRHDADYLHNPAPSYPALSRRLGEQGRVLLRILVSSEGRAESIEIASSSGSPRLDAAAREAVRDWRFVPARQGERAVAASVTVPISFHLDS